MNTPIAHSDIPKLSNTTLFRYVGCSAPHCVRAVHIPPTRHTCGRIPGTNHIGRRLPFQTLSILSIAAMSMSTSLPLAEFFLAWHLLCLEARMPIHLANTSTGQGFPPHHQSFVKLLRLYTLRLHAHEAVDGAGACAMLSSRPSGLEIDGRHCVHSRVSARYGR